MQDLKSISEIFTQRIFRIPDYQRGYSWTSKQLREFWEDVNNLPTNRSHYMGMLTLKEVGEDVWERWNDELWLIKDRKYRPFHVVDGQQRLTTTVIFIHVIYEFIKRLKQDSNSAIADIYLGSFSLKDIIEQYLFIQKPPEKILTSYKFGYETDNPSFQYLRYRIFEERDAGGIEETLYTLNLSNAKKFFSENIKELYEQEGEDAVDELFLKITQNLKFNVYEISDDFDVFVAFETMNNRGKPLSNLELLKNRLIYLSTLYNDSEIKVDEKESLRRDINDAWKEVYSQLGRNKNKRLNDDEFLNAHWIMSFQYTRKKGADYIRFLLGEHFTTQKVFEKVPVKTSFLDHTEDQYDSDELEEFDEDEVTYEVTEQSKLRPKEIKDYISSLKHAAVHWYNTFNPINNPDLTQEESLWLDRINRLGIIYFRPLITVALMKESISSEQRVRLFKEIERFIFIGFRLCRALSTYRNSEFYIAARELLTDEKTIDEIIESLQSNLKWWVFYEGEDGNMYFDTSHFQKYLQKKFNSKYGTGFYSWTGLRYFMFEYEMQKVRERGSQKIDWKLFTKSDKDRVSIEHIYPQTPDKSCWDEHFGSLDDKERHILTHNLGNLLPLSMSVNASLQNDCFEKKKEAVIDNGVKKREGYNNGSHSEIEVAQYQTWSPQTIEQRGLKLLSFMEERWGIPIENEQKKKELLFLGGS